MYVFDLSTAHGTPVWVLVRSLSAVQHFIDRVIAVVGDVGLAAFRFSLVVCVECYGAHYSVVAYGYVSPLRSGSSPVLS